MSKGRNNNLSGEQEPLFDDLPYVKEDALQPPTAEEALARLKRMSQPSMGATVEVAAGFPEERIEGEGYNVHTPEEGKEIDRLTTQKVPYAQAFFEATGRAYIPLPQDKPIYDGKAAYRPHPIKPSLRLRGIADERSGPRDLR
jgi:hypothetical protein